MTEAFTNLAHSKSPKINANSQIEYRRTPKLLTLGGDHSIALPTLRALNKIYGPVAVVHFDVRSVEGIEHVLNLSPDSDLESTC